MTRRTALFSMGAAAAAAPAQTGRSFEQARANGRDFETAVNAAWRLMQAWISKADPRTKLLPDRLDADFAKRVYTPHNSGADLYPYLILTAELTEPEVYQGRMLEMLRNEVRYTSVKDGVPGNLTLATGELKPQTLFGAGEYIKDGLITVTEYLGRTPWFYRMVDLAVAAMGQASFDSRFGKLPAADPELNGDFLQVFPRLYSMTRDARFLEWGRRIGDWYVEEVLPANHGLPGEKKLRLRDHGNETVVGLVLQFALEKHLGSPRVAKWQPVIARMLDRILESANEDGMLYNEIDSATLQPVDKRLSDNWGYVYGAVYTFGMCTGEAKYREAVRRVLTNLPKYRNWCWEPSSNAKNKALGSFDGYADAVESAIYLYHREPVAEAGAWIDSEIKVMLGMQRPDGHAEDWYGEGNFNRTALLWAYLKSQGVRPVRWRPGMRVGAVREGSRLLLSLQVPEGTPVRFDFARHRRVLNLDRNYVRLNEFPEWFAVDENTLYRIDGRVLLGSELIAGVPMRSGDFVLEAL